MKKLRNHGYVGKKKIYWKANSYETSEYQSCFAYSRFLTPPLFFLILWVRAHANSPCTP